MTPKKGLTRIINAAGFSAAGLRLAWKSEAAFRQEVILTAILFPVGIFLGESGAEKALLSCSPFVVVITELLNSGLETLSDRIGKEFHPLVKQAKDMGSAAVFISIMGVICVWLITLL